MCGSQETTKEINSPSLESCALRKCRRKEHQSRDEAYKPKVQYGGKTVMCLFKLPFLYSLPFLSFFFMSYMKHFVFCCWKVIEKYTSLVL